MVRWLPVRVLVPTALAVAALAIAAAAVAGQTPSAAIVGVVTSLPSHRPLSGAVIEIAGTTRRATSDSSGNFRIGGLPGGAYTIDMRAIGYEALTAAVSVATGSTVRVDFEFRPVVLELPGVAVEALPRDAKLQGFYERRAAGFGRFITRKDIETRDARDSKELFRGIPGVRVVGNRLQMTTAMTRRCLVQYFVDGLHISHPSSDILNEFRPRDIEGIEVYRGPAETPPAFSQGGADCGVVAIWTRTPGGR